MPDSKIFQLALLILMAPFLAAAEISEPDHAASFQVKRIAHAGGALGNLTYTNSYQALESNLENGFLYFEIDFVFTSDDHLVCLHDWRQNFKQTFGFGLDEPLSFVEFERLATKNSKFTNCTLEGLADWMRENPSAVIVTDVKDDNIKALRLIGDVLPDSTSRVIPQVYYPRSFRVVKEMGFKQIIWTLYRLDISDELVLAWAGKWTPPFAITMPKERAQSGLPLLLRSKGIPTYVHTVNSVAEMNRFIEELDVTEIYTDFLIP